MNYKIIFLSMISTISVAYNELHLSKLQTVLAANGGIVNASHADLRGIGTALKGAKLQGAQLSGAFFDQISAAPTPQFAGLVEVPKQNSDLSGADLSNAKLVSTSFKGAKLQKANFTGADISYADFTGADLTGAVGLDKALYKELALFSGTTMPTGSQSKS